MVLPSFHSCPFFPPVSLSPCGAEGIACLPLCPSTAPPHISLRTTLRFRHIKPQSPSPVPLRRFFFFSLSLPFFLPRLPLSCPPSSHLGAARRPSTRSRSDAHGRYAVHPSADHGAPSCLARPACTRVPARASAPAPFALCSMWLRKEVSECDNRAREGERNKRTKKGEKREKSARCGPLSHGWPRPLRVCASVRSLFSAPAMERVAHGYMLRLAASPHLQHRR